MTNIDHLAWHETMEIHELVAFQSIGLTKLKMEVKKITDPALRSIYMEAIHSLTSNLKELLQFFKLAPEVDDAQRADTSFYAGDLLGLAKTNVRNYAIAITETATPSVRKVLVKQLLGAINLHATIYTYMYERGYYPSYDLTELLQNDVKNAQKAIHTNL